MKQPQNCLNCKKPLTTDIDIFRKIHGACLPRPSERKTAAEEATRPIFEAQAGQYLSADEPPTR